MQIYLVIWKKNCTFARFIALMRAYKRTHAYKESCT